MKKFILFLSLLTILMSNNLTAQDSRNDIDPNAPKVQGTGNSTEAMYDLLRYHNVDSLITSVAGYGVVWTGNYYIISIFNLNAFYKVSANWTLIAGPIAITGSTLPAANGFRDMEFAKGYLWGVAANSASNRIYKVDTATFTQQSVINLPAGVIPRDLAWDPVRNGFWTSTNNFGGNLQCYDTNGVAIAGATIPTVVGGFYGVAYDGNSAGGPYLWLAKDPSPAGPSITALVKFNISAAPVRLDSAVITIPGTVGAPNLASGGLDFRTNLIPGKSTLIGLVQGTPDKVVVYDVTPTPPPPVGNTLVLVHDTTIASTTQRKADRDTLNRYLGGFIGSYTMKGFDSNTVLPDLSTFNTIILQETSFDAAVCRYLGVNARAQIKTWLASGTASSKKSLISIGADQGYNYQRTGSGGRDLEFSETYGKYTWRLDNAMSSGPVIEGVTIDVGNQRALSTTPPGGSYWPDGCSMIAGGSFALYRYLNHTVNDTLAAIGNVQTGYVVATTFQDPRYFTGGFSNVFSAIVTWVRANGGLITGTGNNTALTIPDSYQLSQNYPNPFNPSTKINFTIPVNGQVSLKVYDVLGKEVMSLVNDVMTAGRHEVTFNGSNLNSGTYFYRLQSGNFVETKKMLLVK